LLWFRGMNDDDVDDAITAFEECGHAAREIVDMIEPAYEQVRETAALLGHARHRLAGVRTAARELARAFAEATTFARAERGKPKRRRHR
jgi:hypothetical protein